MASYDNWNTKIYNEFFTNSKKDEYILFYVNEEVINKIGKILGEENPVESFCKCVLDKICKPRLYNNNEYILKLYNISNEIDNEEIPKQTAFIAFMIYAANILATEEKDTDNSEDEEEYSRGYWNKIRYLIRNIKKVNPSNTLLDNNNYDICYKLFDTFEKYVSDKKFNFKFIKIYNRENRRDIVGKPISHAIITEEDRRKLCNDYFLTFYEQEQDELTDDNLNEIILDDKFSKGFQKIAKNEKLNDFLKEQIQNLYKNYDGSIYKKIGHKVVKGNYIKLIYEDKTYYEEFSCNGSQEEKIIINDNEYTKNDNVFSRSISKEDITLNQLLILNNKIKINDNKKYKLLVFNDNKDRYEEKDTAKINDRALLISTKEFFERNKEKLESTLKLVFEPQKFNDLLYSIKGRIINCSELLNIKEDGKIILKKGLKNGGKSEYLAGAEPLLEIRKGCQDIFYSIDESKHLSINRKYLEPIKLSADKVINSNIIKELYLTTEHEIEVWTKKGDTKITKKEKIGTKTYTIKEKFEEQKSELLYKIIDENCQFVTSDNVEEKVNIINGCNIDNISIQENQKIIDTAKKEYVEMIIKSIYKRFIRNEYNGNEVYNRFLLNEKIYDTEIDKERYIKDIVLKNIIDKYLQILET